MLLDYGHLGQDAQRDAQTDVDHCLIQIITVLEKHVQTIAGLAPVVIQKHSVRYAAHSF